VIVAAAAGDLGCGFSNAWRKVPSLCRLLDNATLKGCCERPFVLDLFIYINEFGIISCIRGIISGIQFMILQQHPFCMPRSSADIIDSEVSEKRKIKGKK
jgi:hypothetical protein